MEEYNSTYKCNTLLRDIANKKKLFGNYLWSNKHQQIIQLSPQNYELVLHWLKILVTCDHGERTELVCNVYRVEDTTNSATRGSHCSKQMWLSESARDKAPRGVTLICNTRKKLITELVELSTLKIILDKDIHILLEVQIGLSQCPQLRHLVISLPVE